MKILIIYATAGAGHKKAAEAIYHGLQARESGYDIRLLDALDYTNPFFKKIYPSGYTFLVTHLPWAWGFFFAMIDLPWMQPLVHGLRRLYNGFNARALEKFLIQEQFDAVITTQFLSAEVSAYLKRRGKIKSRIICVVTDFDVHRIWVNAGIDIYTAACDYTKNKLIALGVAPEKIFITGIPTDPKFALSPDPIDLKKKLGIQDGVWTILIATGSFGMGPIEKIMELLDNYQLLIVCGQNRDLYERLRPKAHKNAHVLGLVDNMEELMAVSDIMVTKPGGLSISEALVKKLPMIFFSAIPGQETNNIKVLSSYEIVYQDQSTLSQIAQTIHEWKTNPKDLDALRGRMSELSKPNAVADIISLL
jgi:processive 1,2-diacylglycerol beta-glucosyltransferase